MKLWREDYRMCSYTDKSKLIVTSQVTDLGIVRGPIKIVADCIAVIKSCINYTVSESE
jgi:hypothetical protein